MLSLLVCNNVTARLLGITGVRRSAGFWLDMSVADLSAKSPEVDVRLGAFSQFELAVSCSEV